MSLTLIATSGAADANAYADVTTAVLHASYRIGGSAFIALTETQQIKALVTATQDIDTLENYPGFVGDRTLSTQSLAFPRSASLTLPTNLVRATIELAMSYAPAIAADSDVLGTTGTGNVKHEITGPLETEYFPPSYPVPGNTAATTIERLPAVVQRLLAALVLQPASILWGSASVVRGS